MTNENTKPDSSPPPRGNDEVAASHDLGLSEGKSMAFVPVNAAPEGAPPVGGLPPADDPGPMLAAPADAPSGHGAGSGGGTPPESD